MVGLQLLKWKDQWTFYTFYWNIYAFTLFAPLRSTWSDHQQIIYCPQLFDTKTESIFLQFLFPRSVFSAVLAWCRGWDSWATIDTRLIIFHISYFSGPGDTSSALRRGPLVHCLWRHCKNSVKDQRRNLKWPQPAASWYKGRTWIISCYQLAINIFIKKKLNHFLSLPWYTIYSSIFTRNFYPNMRAKCHFFKPTMLGCNLLIFSRLRSNEAVIGWYHVTW